MMGQVMDNAADPAELAGLLVALRAKGETPPEWAGLLGALMKRVVLLPVDGTRRPTSSVLSRAGFFRGWCVLRSSEPDFRMPGPRDP
ncbi:hypothetical protein [Nocardiopsis dassonvillei]|uniref:hypothetical protein n=1 Tax=Nocardiopsis dassonvillei TaxID=2014 RepID=UPI003F54FC9A